MHSIPSQVAFCTSTSVIEPSSAPEANWTQSRPLVPVCAEAFPSMVPGPTMRTFAAATVITGPEIPPLPTITAPASILMACPAVETVRPLTR